jgi:hypothetical protein
LQLACDSPRFSCVAQHARQSVHKPQSYMVTKEDTWDACLATLEGHMGLVNSVAISPDGATCASGSDDCTIRYVVGPTAAPRSLACLVVCSPRPFLFCRCASTGPTVSRAQHALRAHHLGPCRLWDLASGQLRAKLEGHRSLVTSVAISPDGTTCASGSDDCTIRYVVGPTAAPCSLACLLVRPAPFCFAVAPTRGQLCRVLSMPPVPITSVPAGCGTWPLGS